jgi:FkbM family methyltransferase
MIGKLVRWVRSTVPWCRRLGVIAGLRCERAHSHAAWHARPGTLVPIPLPWRGGVVQVRAQTSDVGVLRQLVARGELDVPLAFTPRRVLDGGANIGLASRVFRERWPAAEIVAVELDADNVGLARANLRDSDVPVMHLGLWHSVQALRVENPDDEHWARRAEAASPSTGTVRGLPLEMVLDELGWDEVDLVKLDIEGAEVEVLATAAAWLPRIRCLVIETHDRFRPGCTAALRAAIGAGWTEGQHGEYHILTRSVA